jgi:hypothetical protein
MRYRPSEIPTEEGHEVIKTLVSGVGDRINALTIALRDTHISAMDTRRKQIGTKWPLMKGIPKPETADEAVRDRVHKGKVFHHSHDLFAAIAQASKAEDKKMVLEYCLDGMALNAHEAGNSLAKRLGEKYNSMALCERRQAATSPSTSQFEALAISSAKDAKMKNDFLSRRVAGHTAAAQPPGDGSSSSSGAGATRALGDATGSTQTATGDGQSNLQQQQFGRWSPEGGIAGRGRGKSKSGRRNQNRGGLFGASRGGLQQGGNWRGNGGFGFRGGRGGYQQGGSQQQQQQQQLLPTPPPNQ